MANILSTGLSALFTSQRALATTGHNIANVNTTGYSRQRVDMHTVIPQYDSGGYIGRGVTVSTVERIYDEFLTSQVHQHSSSAKQAETQNRLLSQLNRLLATDDAGLMPAVQSFFAAVQDVADTPSSIPARQALISQGESLATRFQNLDEQFSDMRETVNTGVRDIVGEINQLAESIAQTNIDIVVARKSESAQPNDLLDHRDNLLNELSELIDLQTVSLDDGSMNVFIGKGQSLVLSSAAHSLEAVPASANPQDVAVHFTNQNGGTDISKHLSGGQLGGYLAFRDQALEKTHNQLGLLAVGIAETFNTQHRQGMDLNNQLGTDFFQAGPPKVLNNSHNSGTAELSATLIDVNQQQGSDYDVYYDGSQYTVLRLSDNTVVASAASGPLNADGLSIQITSGTPASGDRFLIQPTREAAQTMSVSLSNPALIAAAAPIRTQADNSNQSDAIISPGQVSDINDAGLRNTVTLQFTSATTFDVIDNTAGTTLATGQTYTESNAISFNGWELSISGTPASGDTFQVLDNSNGSGDNRNALGLAALQSTRNLLNSTSTYEASYGRLVADVGTQGARAANAESAQNGLFRLAREARDSLSAVNLDEEAANLMRFQQSYEAATQVIQTANTMFQTVLDVVRRA